MRKNNHIRYDLELISELVEKDSKILDIACGNGELLQFLKKNKNIDGRGLEISEERASQALKNGITIIQGDAEMDLEYYPDKTFDFAILSQTIQVMHDPVYIINQMLRIARFSIISMPNFAHFNNRFYLMFKGRMPINKNIPYEWYKTPNIHFCSLKDFISLCNKMNWSIIKKMFLCKKKKLNTISKKFFFNILAEYGIFLITSK